MKTKFKETEIGMIPEDWEESIFSEIVEVNPKRELKKGNISKFVSMSDLKEFNKKIQAFVTRKFSGGSKFINDDTLMARITPCLENGKIAYVDILDKGEVGSGSTEFIVLSGKEGRTTSQFVYYLAISPEVRTKAIKSMTGTSGRQRVENDVFDKIIVNLPNLTEQRAISKILSDLDSKIELNRQMNKTLEAIGQALFKQWFVDFEFPNEKDSPYKSSGGKMVDSELGEIPKEWEIKSLDETTERITTGLNPRDNFVLGKGENFYVTIKNITDFQEIFLDDRCDRIDDDALVKIRSRSKVQVGDILFSGIATIGRVFLVDVPPERWGLSESIFVFKANEMQISTPLLYRLLLSPNLQSYAQQLASGSVQRGIRMADLKKYKFALPPIDSQNFISNIFDELIKRFKVNNHENQSLSQIRDSLLPRLISGKIRVKVEA